LMGEHEQEEEVGRLLGALERIDAPAGFEGRVLRKIANTNAENHVERPIRMLVLKFAAPAAMLLLLGIFFVYWGDREVNTALVPPVQEITRVTDSADLSLNVSTPASGGILASDQSVRGQGANNARPAGYPPSPRPVITSEDFALQGPGETVTPPGIDPRPRNVDPSAVSPAQNGIKVVELLTMIGISGACDNSGCRVIKVSPGGLADRSKIAAGDRIVSIDGKAISATTNFTGQISFKTIQVMRGDRTVSVSLASN
jgi:hypothetical protein